LIALDFLSTGSELDLQLDSQSSTGNMPEKAIFRSVTVYKKNIQSVQFACSNRKNAG
jgi:hypothetical protein